MSDNDRVPRIQFLYLAQDDPKKSTMKKLERLGLAGRVNENKCMHSLVLTPYADRFLLNSDARVSLRKGICIVDGSWNRISSISTFMPAEGRNLPLIVPANPVNFGKPGKLGSAEALSSALYIMGFKDHAALIMSKFKWGPNFIVMNRELLDDYSSCKEQEEIISVQDSYF